MDKIIEVADTFQPQRGGDSTYFIRPSGFSKTTRSSTIGLAPYVMICRSVGAIKCQLLLIFG